MIDKQIVNKWESTGFLSNEKIPAIQDDYKKYVVAQILENTNRDVRAVINSGDYPRVLTEASPTNVMAASSSTAADGPIDIYDPILIAMVRRAMPKLIAYDVCGVQPMKGPTGTIFALRGRYDDQSGTEMWVNEPPTDFTSKVKGNTAFFGNSQLWNSQVGSSPDALYSNDVSYTVQGGLSTLLAELLGKSTGNAMQEIALTVDKVPVTAKSRAVRASYSVELSQDLMAIHGLSAENELTNFATNEVLAEINREVIRNIYTTATYGAQNSQTPGVFNLDTDADGRWSGEKVLGLLMQIGFEANEIAKATRFGKGNLIMCSSNIATALDMAKVLKYSPELARSLNVDDTGNTFVGVLDNGMKVYIDPYHTTTTNKHFICVGYKGSSPWDAGLFYCPYVPLMFAKAIDPASFQPAIGFKTRYGLVSNPFATSAADGAVIHNKKNRYYRIFGVTNLL